MPSEDYAPVVRGALKLKGAANPNGITKKKKKKKPSTTADTTNPATSSALQKALEEGVDDDRAGRDSKRGGEGEGEEEVDISKLRDLEERDHDGKTASERAYEEMRRRRLQDRLAKEGGVKTHKQRVEELNKYLSQLSEHHDMPRIGPG